MKTRGTTHYSTGAFTERRPNQLRKCISKHHVVLWRQFSRNKNHLFHTRVSEKEFFSWLTLPRASVTDSRQTRWSSAPCPPAAPNPQSPCPARWPDRAAWTGHSYWTHGSYRATHLSTERQKTARQHQRSAKCFKAVWCFIYQYEHSLLVSLLCPFHQASFPNKFLRKRGQKKNTNEYARGGGRRYCVTSMSCTQCVSLNKLPSMARPDYQSRSNPVANPPALCSVARGRPRRGRRRWRVENSAAPPRSSWRLHGALNNDRGGLEPQKIWKEC